jgi:hypothetical protein
VLRNLPDEQPTLRNTYRTREDAQRAVTLEEYRTVDLEGYEGVSYSVVEYRSDLVPALARTERALAESQTWPEDADRIALAEARVEAAERELQDCEELMVANGVDAPPAECADRVFAMVELLRQQRESLRSEKDGAYAERDKCIALIARMAEVLGLPVWRGRHEGGEWDDDWRNVIYVELAAGQVSWHVHDSEMPMFKWVPLQVGGSWDGHDTEEKYRRALESPIYGLRKRFADACAATHEQRVRAERAERALAESQAWPDNLDRVALAESRVESVEQDLEKALNLITELTVALLDLGEHANVMHTVQRENPKPSEIATWIKESFTSTLRCQDEKWAPACLELGLRWLHDRSQETQAFEGRASFSTRTFAAQGLELGLRWLHDRAHWPSRKCVEAWREGYDDGKQIYSARVAKLEQALVPLAIVGAMMKYKQENDDKLYLWTSPSGEVCISVANARAAYQAMEVKENGER